MAASAAAQTAAPAAPDDEVEEVIVTGSRIVRANEVSATPVNTVSAQQLQERGVVNVTEALATIPQIGGNPLSPSGAPRNTLTAGLYTVDLRSLGSSRTLVLVNGRRHVSGQAATSAVDLNSIPTDLIDRVEVTTGGASAVYGSDAVAGVVNFLLKKNFEGMLVRGQVGQASRGDGSQYKLSFTGGGNFADGKGNAVLFASYDRSEPIYARDRPISRTPVVISNATRPDLAVFGPDAFAPLSSRTGVFGLNAATAAASTIQRTVLPNGTIATPLASRDSFNPADYTIVATPSKRWLLGANLRYALTGDVDLFMDMTYSRAQQLQRYEPIAVAIGPGDTSVIPNTIPVSNPFIPAALRALIPAGRTEIAMSRTFPEFGPSETTFDRDLQRVVFGAEGKLPRLGEAWRWDAYYQYGRTTLHTVQFNKQNRLRLSQSLNVASNGAGGFQCADAAARAQGCVPVNLFTGNPLTTAEINWLRVSGAQDSKNQQQVAAANISGELFRLPGGPIGVAAGFEWRREEAQFLPDEVIRTGQAFLTQGTTKGSFSVKEAFIEATAPLLKDLPFVQSLELEGAFRRADYSTSGGANAWKLGGSYRPIEDIRFRVLYATAVRAPNISELFSGNLLSNLNVQDPCRGGGTGGRTAYCLAQPGVSAAFNPAAAYQVQQVTGGNINLRPEQAKTWTAGFVLTPSFFRGFSLSADYFDITIDGAITTFTPQLVANQCADTNDQAYCSLVVRDRTSGLIVRQLATPINASSTKLSGVDVEASYRLLLDDVGGARLGDSLTATFNYTWTRNYKTVPLPGSAPTVLKGQPFSPEHKANLRLNYAYGPLSLSANERYYGKVYRVVGGTFDGNEVGAKIYSDFQARYAFGRGVTAYAGINNAFDVQPPLIPVPYVQTSTGTNTAASVYDLVGRFFYAGFELRF